MTKITYTNAIDTIATYLQDFEVPENVAIAIDRMGDLKEALAKRNSAKSGKPTKTQRENAEVKERIVALLTDKGLKCGDIAEAVGISGQKCSALLSQLVEEGKVAKTTEKRVSFFSAPTVVAE